MHPAHSPFRSFVTALVCVACLVSAGRADDTKPDNAGPVKLLSASWLGGNGDDELVAAAIAPDLTLIVAGNTIDLQPPKVPPSLLGPDGVLDATAADPKAKGKKWTHPSTHGFIARISTDGKKYLSFTRFGYGLATIRKLRLDEKGNIFILGEAPSKMLLAGTRLDKGTFIAALGPQAASVKAAFSHPGALDFGIDGNGEIVVLTKARLTRFSADGKTEKWSVTWKAYGDNRPGAMTLSPETGVAAVTGYGMTNTGKEPYKDPYGYGFDRAGKPLWSLWNPDPQREKDVKWSTPELKTNGLMADTTGYAAAFGPQGKIYFVLYADGGNSVCTRDPHDVDRPLDAKIFAGVYQPGPGFGFKGASRTSVIFRLDAEKGTLEKGTWLCAWLTKARANALSIDAAAGDTDGRQFLVGNSAFGCPTREPWYVCKDGGYQGGGYLAVFDRDFKLLQCGYFPAASLTAVATRGPYVLVTGHARQYEDPDSRTAARTYQPLQPNFGGGSRDGYFAVFKRGE